MIKWNENFHDLIPNGPSFSTWPRIQFTPFTADHTVYEPVGHGFPEGSIFIW